MSPREPVHLERTQQPFLGSCQSNRGTAAYGRPNIPINTVQKLRQPLRFIRYTSWVCCWFTKQVPKSNQLAESRSDGTATIARRGTS